MNIIYRILLIVVFVEVFGLQTSTTAQTTTVVHSMAWNPDGTILALGGVFDGRRALQLVDVNRHLSYEIDRPYSALGLSWRPDGAQLASYGSDGYTIWDASTGAIVLTFAQQGATRDYFTHWNPTDFDQFATVVRDVVHLRNASTGQIETTLDAQGGIPDSVLSVSWSQDGATIYTVSEDNVIRIWDVNTTTLQNEIQLDFGTYAFAMSPDATKLAIAGQDDLIHVYDTSGILLTSFGGLPDAPIRTALVHVAWNPDGTQVAAADNLGTYIWDVETGQLVNKLLYQTESIHQEAMTFSPSGAFTYPSGDPHDLILLAPIANAGADQTVSESGSITLNGAGSSDSDGTIVAYSWIENGVEIATGANPQVTLSAGVHTIILNVTDNDGATGGDVVVITVE